MLKESLALPLQFLFERNIYACCAVCHLSSCSIQGKVWGTGGGYRYTKDLGAMCMVEA